MLIEQTGQFFIRERKRLLILLLVSTIYTIATYSFLFLMSPKALESTVSKFGGLVLTAIRSIIEMTITYYVLIFTACLSLLRDRKIGKFFLILLLLFIVKMAYSFIFEYEKTDFNANSNSEKVSIFIRQNKFLFYFIIMTGTYLFNVFICFIIASFIEFDYRNKRQDELVKQKMDAELTAIKYQINPHFLFNSLSFIYSRTVPLSEEVSNAVLLLSDIMRYALGKEEDEEGKVALDKEITHMKNVVEINQMRFNNKLSIQYSEQIDNLNARITPLVLITLVENAFKHGDLLDEANPLVIRTEADTKRIRFYISNKKKGGTKELSTGIGLNNVKQRLSLMYPKKHTFSVSENEHFYTTELIINL